MKFSLGCLFLFFQLGATCFRSSPGGGSAGQFPDFIVVVLTLFTDTSVKKPSSPGPATNPPDPPTNPPDPPTTSAPVCERPPGQPGIFVADSVSGAKIDFQSTPTKSCPCAGGTKHYFEEVIAKRAHKPLTGFELKCGTEACVCVSENECYRPSVDTIELRVHPFCEEDVDGSCAMYMVFIAEDDADTMNPSEGSTGAAITYGSQKQPRSGTVDLFTSGRFKKAISAGCGECVKVAPC
uniref:Uncharacterized protein n=1 Tax=Steinernema glaseri TaxID=37863 RepID=A0A1I7YHX5_9BILA